MKLTWGKVCAAMLFCGFCVGAGVAAPVEARSISGLAILPSGWLQLKLGYERGPMQERVFAAYDRQASASFRVTDAQIATCFPEDQAIELTQDATRDLARHLSVETTGELADHLNLRNHAYVFLQGNEAVSAGIFLARHSAMAIRFETIEARLRDDRLVLRRMGSLMGPLSKRVPWPQIGAACMGGNGLR